MAGTLDSDVVRASSHKCRRNGGMGEKVHCVQTGVSQYPDVLDALALQHRFTDRGMGLPPRGTRAESCGTRQSGVESYLQRFRLSLSHFYITRPKYEKYVLSDPVTHPY